jgi:penicillin-binding protein 1A
VLRFTLPARSRLPRSAVALLAVGGVVLGGLVAAWLLVVAVVVHAYFDQENLPDLALFNRFEFQAIGRIYDSNEQPLIELAHQRRDITQYADIPPLVRDAILAAEDKRFFSHDGVDIYSLPRVIGKVRIGAWATWLAAGPGRDNDAGRAVFPQGGSTITQQLVRGVFLQAHTSQENSYELRSARFLPRVLSWVVGARNVNMLMRKREEIRLSLWLERRMVETFGSKRRAKEELFARYASFVYMGSGQYGVDRAADYYFGNPLSALTGGDADKAALLAGIAKSPRDYGLTADPTAILRRRNQILALMEAAGFLSTADRTAAQQRPLPPIERRTLQAGRSSAVVDHVLDELTSDYPALSIEDLLQGHIQIHSTVDARVQAIVSDALDHGLERYERRHRGKPLVQGSIVVLRNGDGSVLAEVGGRQRFRGRQSTYSDFNRARRSMRQPGSAMKPMVYLAAFRYGAFTLDTLVPDEPISVPNGSEPPKWISNYDGLFKGMMPVRTAFAESRNAVAIWMAREVGIDKVLRAAQSVGIRTPLQRYATTALGASEVNLLELATAYRTIASGRQSSPFVIRSVVTRSGDASKRSHSRIATRTETDDALVLVQEALRGVVRLPSGTAHALDARAFSIAVMGKTGTTNEFRDALFVGSTYGVEGITVAVRVGFDDNRTLGARETGGRVALPIFREVMLRLYGDRLVGSVPVFPRQMEQRISNALFTALATPDTIGNRTPGTELRRQH